MRKITTLMSAAAMAVAGGYAALPAPASAQARRTSPRSSSTAPIRARARPTTRSSSAPAARKRSAIEFHPTCARAARRSRCSRGPSGRRALETVGATGINSCSPVGPAGYTGCLEQVIQEAQRRAQAAGGRRNSAAISAFVESGLRCSAACYAAHDAGREPLIEHGASDAGADARREGELLRSPQRASPISPSPRCGSASPITA